jgi:hypothetical protein
MASIDTCANCDAPIVADKRALYDDHAERHFCDRQCFREWTEGDGGEKVLAFYQRMNLHEVTY